MFRQMRRFRQQVASEKSIARAARDPALIDRRRQAMQSEPEDFIPKRLIDAANDGGGGDNISAVVISR